MTTFLCILALIACGLIIVAATGKIPLWIGTLVLGFVVLIPLMMVVFK